MALPTADQLAAEQTLMLVNLLNRLTDELKKPSRLGPVKIHEAFIAALGT